MIGVINYDRGNLRSVAKSLEASGAAVTLVSEPRQFDALQAIVLPGVGAFGDAARNLRERELWEPIRQWIAAGRPFLGICLGYQLLFEGSEETPGVPGLGVLPGQVVRFAPAPGLKVPHMGWNTLDFPAGNPALARVLPPAPAVYFVHSYFPAPADASLIAATADYGAAPFAAAIARGPLWATQFHPEKSQATGLSLLSGFLEMARGNN